VTGRPVDHLRASLEGRLDGTLRTDEVSRSLWSSDASIYLRRPAAVVTAASETDVRRTLGAARAAGVAVTPRGGGTSLAGQATAPGVALDVSRMDRLRALDPQRRRCSVEPGVVQAELNTRLREHGLFFAVDTSTSDVATIGGMIGNDSSGTRSVAYGRTSAQVRGLRCLLADGSAVELGPLPRSEAEARARSDRPEAPLLRSALELADRYGDEIRRRFPRLLRRVSGYALDALVDARELDLTRLVCGSEGTLALVTRADLKLEPVPAERAMASFEFDSLGAAARATRTLLDGSPTMVEMLDDVAIGRARATPAYRDAVAFVSGEPRALLVVEWTGQGPPLEELGSDIGATAVVPLRTAAEQERTTRLRKAILPLLLGPGEGPKPTAFVEDAAVPPDRLEEYLERFQAIVAAHGTWGCFYGHASVGCLHVRPAIDTRAEGGVERMRSIADEVAELVVELGGSISGEHGDGLSRSEFLPRMFGGELMRAFRELKRTWDPDGLLGPGVIVDPPPMDRGLRHPPGQRPRRLDTHLDFSRQGGFAAAVELCNGSGFCRKRSTGTMCPSYMATSDERDTTRARANALRSVLDGTLALDELSGPGLRSVMDLCVGCKACKSECPSQVDVASMKVEVLAQIGEREGFGFRQHAAAHVRSALALASPAAGFVNAAAATRLARLIGERVAGVDRRRRPPRLARRSFRRRFRGLAQGPGSAEVALFNDTWTNYERPEIGEAATRLLAAAGARVLLPRVRCCGRPMLSVGLVDAARRNARSNLDALWPYLTRGMPVAGLEPSCILTLRDDYRMLLPDDDRVGTLERGALLFEEALLALEPSLKLREGGRVLLHGHCHQKALVGTGATEEALRLAPGTHVETLDSGCCGMAGLFGYEREHYDVSMRMAERRLLPAVRSAADAAVVAPGVSCRTQIADGSGRPALHPAEFLAALLV
jgi:FAD/FMN-containing dehydrogenase/Fe-S oxidoreductase